MRAPRDGRRPRRRWLRRLGLGLLAVVVVLTAASVGYNLATDGAAPRPPGLTTVDAGGFETRYRSWGTTGPVVVLVPGAFETADTFAPLGADLGRDHRVFALDLTGTGYSRPSAPFDATHMADQVLAFMRALGVTRADAPVLVGHSSGAAVVGEAALRGGATVAGIVFLDGDAAPLATSPVLATAFVDPYRTSVLRLGLRSDAMIRQLYDSQCGPGCPRLTSAGVDGWRRPLLQPGLEPAMTYMLRHGIPAMTGAGLDRLRASALPRRVVVGAHDPQLSLAAAARTAARIGAPPPIVVPGRHLTMISAPGQVAAAVRALAG